MYVFRKSIRFLVLFALIAVTSPILNARLSTEASQSDGTAHLELVVKDTVPDWADDAGAWYFIDGTERKRHVARSGAWTNVAPPAGPGQTTATYTTGPFASLTEEMVGWTLQPDVNQQVYIPIRSVDPQQHTITVSGAFNGVGGVGTRFRIFAPPGVETFGPSSGTLSYWVSAESSRCLYGGYRYESPLAGFANYDTITLPGPPPQLVQTRTISHRQDGKNFAGLYYTLHRHYDPTLMRFTSPDPLASPFYNLHHYAGNNPARYFDPDGLRAKTLGGGDNDGGPNLLNPFNEQKQMGPDVPVKVMRLWHGDKLNHFSDDEIAGAVGDNDDMVAGGGYALRNIATGKLGFIGLFSSEGIYGHIVSREEYAADRGVDANSLGFTLGEAGTEFLVDAAFVIGTAGLGTPVVAGSRGGTLVRVGTRGSRLPILPKGYHYRALKSGTAVARNPGMRGKLPQLYLRNGSLTKVKPSAVTGKWSWSSVRGRLGRSRWAKSGQEVHHWLIPQRGWGSRVPGWIKNRKWNLMRMPSQGYHRSVHGWGSNGFGMAGRLWHGSPTWAKVAGPVGAGAAGAGLAYMSD